MLLDYFTKHIYVGASVGPSCQLRHATTSDDAATILADPQQLVVYNWPNVMLDAGLVSYR